MDLSRIRRLPGRVGRIGIAGAAAACLALAGAAATAQTEPQATSQVLPPMIKIVVPFSPGASNDIFARALSQRISSKYGNVKVIVDNRPGAGGAIGSDIVARSKPDGATLLLTSASFATNAAVQKNLAYNPITSFAPVAILARGPMLVVVGNSSPYKTLGDYLAAARQPGARINFGSPGVGSIGHLGGQLMNSTAGAHGTHIPYKGVSNAVTDMIGGNLQMMVTTAASVSGAIASGGMRPLAVTSAERSAFAPGLPTVAEQVPGYSLEVWWAVLAPAGTPRPVVEALNAEIREWANTPDMREMFARESTAPSSLTPTETQAFLASEVTKWQKVAKDSNIVID